MAVSTLRGHLWLHLKGRCKASMQINVIYGETILQVCCCLHQFHGHVVAYQCCFHITACVLYRNQSTCTKANNDGTDSDPRSMLYNVDIKNSYIYGDAHVNSPDNETPFNVARCWFTCGAWAVLWVLSLELVLIWSVSSSHFEPVRETKAKNLDAKKLQHGNANMHTKESHWNWFISTDKRGKNWIRFHQIVASFSLCFKT